MPTIDTNLRPIVMSHETRNVACATPPTVLWKNTETPNVAADPDDPAGTIATDTNCIVLHNPNGMPWLCAFPLISGAILPTVALVGSFYGFIPFTGDEQAQKGKPSAHDSTNFDDSVLGSARNRLTEGNTAATVPGLWIKLRELNATAAAAVTFDNTASADKDSTASSTKAQITLTPRYIYTQGVSQIVFLPSTAHDAPITAGQLVGFLHS